MWLLPNDSGVRRRDVIRRIGAASAVAVGATGITAGREATHVVWGTDGERTVLPIAEFDRRPDTPSVETLDTEALSSPPCCSCVGGLTPCTDCENGCETTLQEA